MSRNRICFTAEEVLAHLDGDLDIPNEGVNSDVEWLDDGDCRLVHSNRRGGGGGGGN